MAILKCKMCGGDIELSPDKTFGTCDSCGSTMTFPKVDDEQRANMFNRGNHFRRTGEFDKALAVYERIVQEDDTDAEAHWCCALCRFGIEYVEDPVTFEYLPTCHRASFDSFLEDIDYLAAVEHSDGITRRQYQKDAAKIAEVQRGILATSQSEEPFDVFICYKESENDGNRTRDSLLAQEIYYQLTEQGRRVFFSRITLEDKAGTEYEPYIFAALNSAKVMIVVTTSAEHVNSVWVKNEWSRFLSLMRKDRSKLLLPCYRDMDPYDLPEALSVLQSYDMSKIGFIQDLIRGVNKVLNTDDQKAVTKETVIVQQTSNSGVEPLLKRAFMFLDDSKWQEADEYCERVLDQDPENPQAYIGKLMAELKVRRQEYLKDCKQPFDGSGNYQKAVRFSDEKTSSELKGYIKHINYRNENTRLEGIYGSAVRLMDSADSEEKFKKAADIFKTVNGYRDSATLAAKCLEKAEIMRKDGIYESAKSKMSKSGIKDFESARTVFKSIPGWKDADEMVLECEKKIEEIKQKEEADRIAQKKKLKKIISIVTPIILVCAVFAVVLITVILPKQKYNQAMELLDSGKYDEAYAVLEEIGDNETIVSNKYDRALALIDSGDYVEAYALLEEIGDNESIASNKYDRAIKAIESGDYKAAYTLLRGMDYKDSESKLQELDSDYKKQLFQEAEIGKSVLLGMYEQDNDDSNGKENIEWIIIAKENDRFLILSRYALDCKPFGSHEEFWASCSIREWLNSAFYNDAFTSDEQKMIQDSSVTADKNPNYTTNSGKDVTDKLFLLSIDEANKYLLSDSARMCIASEYALKKGANVVMGKCNWWLRTQGYTQNRVAFVQGYGGIDINGQYVSADGLCVRPALWIKIS